MSPPSLTSGTNFICIVCVARYHIASKCFYMFLLRHPGGEIYHKNCIQAEALPKIQAFLHKARFGTIHLSQRREHRPIRW